MFQFVVVALYSVQQASNEYHVKNILIKIARTLAFDDLKAFLQVAIHFHMILINLVEIIIMTYRKL